MILDISLLRAERGGALSTGEVKCSGGQLIECGTERWIIARDRLRDPVLQALDDEELALHCQANEPSVVGIIRRDAARIFLFVTTNGGALYFQRSSTGERFRFADTPNQLVESSTEQIDEAYAASVVRNHPSRRPPFSSLYTSVQRIPPGAKCTLSRHEKKTSVGWWRELRGSATLREAFLTTLSMLVEGKECHVLLSGGLDSANIVAGLRLLGVDFTAHHFVTSAEAQANATEQSRFLGFDLAMHQYNKRAIDFSAPLEKAKSGVLSGTRPRLRMLIPDVDLTEAKTVCLSGQNADALLSIHDYTIPRKVPTSRGALERGVVGTVGRILLTDAACRLITTLGPQARRRYLAGLLMPSHDVCLPVFSLDPVKDEAKEAWKALEPQYFPDSSPVPLRSFDVKAARWLEYASHATENAWMWGIRYPYSSGLMFPYLLQARLDSRTVGNPKWMALELYRDLTGASYQSIAVTGRDKFNESKGVLRDEHREREGLIQGLSLVDIEPLLNRFGMGFAYDMVTSRHQHLSARAQAGVISGKDFDSVGGLVALSGTLAPKSF